MLGMRNCVIWACACDAHLVTLIVRQQSFARIPSWHPRERSYIPIHTEIDEQKHASNELRFVINEFLSVS